MPDCDATADVGRDGQLFCEREPGHEGMHRGAVWWFPLPELDYIELPGFGDGSTAPDCTTCSESEGAADECPGSERPCGHHCNHIWGEDACCWCPAVVNGDGDVVPGSTDQGGE